MTEAKYFVFGAAPRQNKETELITVDRLYGTNNEEQPEGEIRRVRLSDNLMFGAELYAKVVFGEPNGYAVFVSIPTDGNWWKKNLISRKNSRSLASD